jgi:thermostable 8-oxoguanine DNA glycosylase
VSALAAAVDPRELTGTFGSRTVDWLTPAHLGSAAFWIDQTARSTFPPSPRLGVDLAEELVACMLGGYGITGPMTTAAFEATRDAGLIRGDVTATEILDTLRHPLDLPGGRQSRYRFAQQRAHRISSALSQLWRDPPPGGMEPRELRDWLLSLPGVGMKTASWVVRNALGAEDVAILDIHVMRAGLVAGVFDPSWTLGRDYRTLESAFCAWATEGNVQPSHLDVCVWSQLAHAARLRVRLDAS